MKEGKTEPRGDRPGTPEGSNRQDSAGGAVRGGVDCDAYHRHVIPSERLVKLLRVVEDCSVYTNAVSGTDI